ncbi:DUF4145 domain-containing protein [[Kitasatospora] papulosa]|uniref:DUF4145 domain-containing protein n=1 Tax=[Kitasatospora] papulosa TaxID=1464011 RepID=UPI00367E3CFC
MGGSFDRRKFEALAGPFSEWPSLLCPQCGQITLESDIVSFQSVASLSLGEISEEDAADPSGYFYGELKCPRMPCGNRHVVVGEWGLDWGPASIAGTENDPYLFGYTVKHILPELPLVDTSFSVPEELMVMINSASAVLLADPSAAANRIRSAIDCLLDDKGVRKYPPNSRKSKLTTHKRIELFKAKNSAAADQLMAMKWIGNVGSHESDLIPLAFLLDGIEHFARALELVYDPRERDLTKRAALINRKGRNLKITKSR